MTGGGRHGRGRGSGKGRGGFKPNQSATRTSQRNRSASAAKRQRISDSDSNVSEIADFIQSVSRDDNSIKVLVDELLKNENIRNCLIDVFRSDVFDELQNHINTLELRLDDMEQYSRRTCLKISGIPEPETATFDEDTDSKVLSVINKMIIKHHDRKLSLRDIGRTHRIGERKKGRTRDIIIRFISYRDRALVYSNKKNLKMVNDEQDNVKKRIYVNEALTLKRATLFRKARQLKHDKLINSCWTHDGKILVRNLTKDETFQIKTEKDLTRFLKLKITSDVPETDNQARTPRPAYTKSSKSLSVSANIFRPLAGLTSTPVTSEVPLRARSSSANSNKSY
ncbi:unnamed protein product [Mytilus edulis]|uniref:FP protein C-terminal domain-containing protein n=1 Tax=Mytilus edulis TaxID=6550 RepID=A0A8S3SP39_MYTED|nr:unnamed protein product [Mytilus edulis]